MENCKISVNVNYANGNSQNVITTNNPQEAIDEYFFPDAGMPITVNLSFTDSNGKSVSISIGKNFVNVR